MPGYFGKLCSGYNEYLCAADAAPRTVTIIARAGQRAGALYLSLYKVTKKPRPYEFQCHKIANSL